MNQIQAPSSYLIKSLKNGQLIIKRVIILQCRRQQMPASALNLLRHQPVQVIKKLKDLAFIL